MKKVWKILCIALCIAVLAAVFAGCKEEEEQPQDEGIVVMFVTGFESDGVMVKPIRITEQEPGSLPEDPGHAGYEFTGWYYDKECTRKFSTGDTLTTDVILYAGWAQKRSSTNGTGKKQEVVAPNGLVYTLTDEEYVVAGYTGEDQTVTVPASYMGYAVTAFAEKAFGTNETLENIEFSGNIKTIDRTAFIGLKALKNVNVSSSDYFHSVNGILLNRAGTELIVVGQGRQTAFTLPASVKTIGENAFYGCTFAVTIAETDALTVVDSYAFAGYAGKLTLSTKVAEIRKKAFFDATCEIVFPTGCAIAALGNGEFDGYKGETLFLPSSVRSISGSPFYDCTAALNISATGITTLGSSAIAGYAGREFVVPYFVGEIEANCFYRCKAKVTFDERTTYSTIKELTFNQFAGEVILPTTVTKVEKNAFYAARYATVRFSTKQSQIVIEDNAFALCPKENNRYTNIFYAD